MGRIRSFLRRIVKPAAMVGVVGILSLGLVVTTPSNAEALVKYPKIDVETKYITGAVKTIAPAAMTVASFTPIGLPLRIAMLAFSTTDLWMPLVTGAFGQGSGGSAPAGSMALTTPNLQLSTLTQPNTWSVRATATYSGSAETGGNVDYGYQVQQALKCQDVDGVSYVKTFTATGSFVPGGQQVLPYSCNAEQDRVLEAQYAAVCGLTVSWAGAGCTQKSNVYGPANVVTIGSTGFDPRSPEVGYQGRSECVDVNGAVSWVDGPITPGDNGAMLMPSCEKAGKGHGTGRTQLVGFRPDGAKETIWDTGEKPLSDPATPLCDPGRPGSGCVMEVLKDDKPCATGDVECENWASEHSKAPSRWKCKLGPYTLPMASCNLLERAYVPGGAPLNDPNTDGDPATRSNLGPDSQPAPVQSPTVTGTIPGTPTVPGGGGAPAAGADQQTRNCFPTGWAAFNPVEWVLKPLRCAFEPSQNPQDMVTRLGIRSATKAPISFLNMEMIGPSGSGCPNWVISVPGFSQNVVCESSFTAAILSVRAPLFGLVATAMIWPLLRSLWYAAIPILRVTPSSGGK
jgi:hypothetical protein